MRVFLCAQYSPDWWALRSGIPTASSFDRIFTGGGKPSGQQEKYVRDLIEERTNPRPNAFSERGRIGTPAMEAGRAVEPEARAFYCLERNVRVQEVGFVLSECGRFGCSPDGLVCGQIVRHVVTTFGNGQRFVEFSADGALELKCPLIKTQEKYLSDGDLPLCYRPQVHGQLITTGLPWIDFLSYADGCDPLLVRVEPDDYTQALREELERFLQKYADAWADAQRRPHELIA